MPAPNTAVLWDLEGNYEDPLANYFANANIGGQTFSQVITPRSNLTAAPKLVTPRLMVSVTMIGMGPDGSGVMELPVTSNNVASNYYAYYQLNAELTVVTSRSNSLQNHRILRGGVRDGMTQGTAILNNTTVPYYQTAFVSPGASVQGINEENDEISTSMSYLLDVFIPPASFPA